MPGKTDSIYRGFAELRPAFAFSIRQNSPEIALLPLPVEVIDARQAFER
ncbi:hypothetical protein [Methylomonas methanica]|nr:hypothetical protein [Methylomonas methanica]